jgi:hypothetical protein
MCISCDDSCILGKPFIKNSCGTRVLSKSRIFVLPWIIKEHKLYQRSRQVYLNFNLQVFLYLGFHSTFHVFTIFLFSVQVELVYQTQFFKGLSTGCNVSPALSQGNYLFTHSTCPVKVRTVKRNESG